MKYNYEDLSVAEKRIYDLLTKFQLDPKNHDQLSKRSGFSEFHVKAAIQLLTLKGLLNQRGPSRNL
ncbi:hypothetical protein SY83_19785 [Paenibacillus swuensis]|uniref:MarR family transcriptional regulator n=1 Tax=Paenibacillus swuensis TaxID=1178515 RepID=A0A172TM64_9BACL|nr:hypothetical protein [Paenibacillus swuensis]ANE48159.1 hypothetical protein SY83_19785 [Paenibacillus swuensis]